MSKLLRANFKRLFQSRLFWNCMVILVCMGVSFVLKRGFDIRMEPERYAELPDDYKCTEGFAFSGAFHIIFVVAVVLGSFVGTEYSDGTIRNKVIVGHDKRTIYLATLIVSAAASVLLLLAEMIAMFLVGKLVFTVSIMSVGEIVACAVCECVSMMALSAVLVFLAMLIPNKAAGSVTVLLTVMVLFVIAMVLDDRMSLPEYYMDYVYTAQGAGPDYVYTAQDAGTSEAVAKLEMVKDPHYPEGLKREIYQFLYDFIPVCQFSQVNREYYDKIPVLLGYSLLLCMAVTAGGVQLFYKKDLN